MGLEVERTAADTDLCRELALEALPLGERGLEGSEVCSPTLETMERDLKAVELAVGGMPKSLQEMDKSGIIGHHHFSPCSPLHNSCFCCVIQVCLVNPPTEVRPTSGMMQQHMVLACFRSVPQLSRGEIRPSRQSLPDNLPLRKRQ